MARPIDALTGRLPAVSDEQRPFLPGKTDPEVERARLARRRQMERESVRDLARRTPMDEVDDAGSVDVLGALLKEDR